MKREQLLEKLELVAPALSKNDLVPVLKHFWFKNDAVMAYNDQIAIKTKLASGFTGAVSSVLVGLLKASRAKEVEFAETAKGNLMLKAASAKFKLPFLPDETTKIFQMPEPNIGNAIPIDMGTFLEAIGSCMLSLKEDPSIPDSLGITIVRDDGCMHLYSTNDATISTSSLVTSEDGKEIGRAHV